MTRGEAITRLRRHQADLMGLGVEHLYLFGSVARNEAADHSDIDLFFDHERGRLGLFELMDVKERTAAILGRETDVMTRASLHPALKEGIEKSAVQVF
jgi:predicted nucleotidyltransferase